VIRSNIYVALDYALGPSHEIVIVGDPVGDDTRALIRECRTGFLPSAVILHTSPGANEPGTKIAPYSREYSMINGRATVYVCSRHACAMPVSETAKLKQLLEGKSGEGFTQ
jgi:uncharacterized protein YyaL (SSP411 family)